MKKNLIIGLSLVLAFFVTSCSLEPTIADAEEGMDILDAKSMRQMIDGSYVTMSNYRYHGRNMIIAGEIRADNVHANGNSGRFVRWSNMNILSTDSDVGDLMRYAYSTVSNANLIIDLDLESVEGDEEDKNQVLGEAYAMRAYAHFDLMRLFGQRYIDNGSDLGISYVKDYKVSENNKERGTFDDNIADLKSDIADAIQYLEAGQGSQFAANKTNFTLDAAYALQSRVGTYIKDYEYAYEGSSEIVDNYAITPEEDFVEYWKEQTPPEASIMELYQNTSDNNQSINGIANIYRGTSYGDVEPMPNLVADAEFESDDIRASSAMISGNAMNGYINAGKYPSMGTELGADNIKIFRIEEIVLNHAEALANGAGAGDALEYLNSIPENRGASSYGDASMENIIKERRKELVFEGFRFFDLARTGMDIRDMGQPLNNHGEISAGDDKFALPIPQRELDTNRDAVQNPGYGS